MEQKSIETEINTIGQNQVHEWNKFKFISFEGKDKYGGSLVKIKRLKNNDEKIYKISEIRQGRNPFNIKSYLPEEYIAESVNMHGQNFKENTFVFVKIVERNSKNIEILIRDTFQNELVVRYSRLLQSDSNPFVSSFDVNIEEITKLGQKESNNLFKFDFINFDKKKRLYTVKNKITSEEKSLKLHQLRKENYFKNTYVLKSEIIKKLSESHKSLVKVEGWNFTLNDDNVYRLDNFTKFYYEDESGKEFQTNGLFFNRILENKSSYRTINNIIEELNDFGNSFENDYEKFKVNEILDNKKVIVENLKTGELETTSLESLLKKSNPFNSRTGMTDLRIFEIVNEIGLNYKNKEEQFDLVKIIQPKNEKEGKKVIIKNLYSNETTTTRLNSILKGENPFKNHLPFKLIKEKVNEIGSAQKEHEQFEFLRVKKYLKSNSESRIYVKNISSGEVKESSYNQIVNALNNPFNLRSKLTDFEIERRTNEIGQNQEENQGFKFIRKYKYLKNRDNLQIIIENLTTKERMTTNFNSLMRFQHSPFDKTQDLDEVKKVHPKIRQILNKMNLEYDSEIRITKRSQLDFLIYLNNGKVLIVEAKSDKKGWSLKEIERQVEKYNEDGKEVFGDLFLKIIVVSPSGKYGIALNELESVINGL